MEEMQINWAAFAVAVVAQMVIGFLWFHPAVMGKMWAKANGVSIEEMKPKNPGMVYGLTILYTLFFTMFLITNVTGPGQDVAPDGHSYVTFQHGLAHAVILTIMVILPVIGTPALYEGKTKGWMVVQIGYWFARLAVAAGILSAWR
jgi:Protein of unknown function (DUF1761)